MRDIHFEKIWAMDGPAMLPPVLKGDVKGVALNEVSVAGVSGAKPVVLEGAVDPTWKNDQDVAAFEYTPGTLKAAEPVQFTANAGERAGRTFEWIFGDGERSTGRTVTHRFADAEGTLLDGSGRYRVLLHVRGPMGEEAWGSQGVVLARKAPVAVPRTEAGAGPIADAQGRVFEGSFHVPAEGGYTLSLLTSTQATISLDDGPAVSSPRPQKQVCGSVGDAVQLTPVSAVLAKGMHRVRVYRSSDVENAELPTGVSSTQPVLLWEGPGIPRQVLPLSRANESDVDVSAGMICNRKQRAKL